MADDVDAVMGVVLCLALPCNRTDTGSRMVSVTSH